MKSYLLLTLFILAIFFSVALPASAVNIWENTSGNGCNAADTPCTFCDFLIVTDNIIEQILFPASLSIGAIMVAFGALRLILAGGNPQRVQSATKIITTALLAIAIALLSWSIVNIIINMLASGSFQPPWYTISC